MKGECSEKSCPRAPGSPGGDSGEEITPVWPGLACAWHSCPQPPAPTPDVAFGCLSQFPRFVTAGLRAEAWKSSGHCVLHVSTLGPLPKVRGQNFPLCCSLHLISYLLTQGRNSK